MSNVPSFKFPWQPDLGNGFYANPIIHADYSDPDVIKHGDDFYLVASSFNCTPGLPVLHSRDLVHWTIINHAIKNLPHPRYKDVWVGSGVWAPAIRFHAGKFWIFFPMVEDGIYTTWATDPAGEWSEPKLLLEGPGFIDPCPFWDEDGQAYLIHAYARSRSGLKDKIHVRPMAPDCSQVLGDGQIVFDSPEGHPFIEGPKVHKRNGYYYIFAPAGGVPTGWQTILRSTSIYGPYVDKIVLERGSTEINGPHQGAWVELDKDEHWFIHFQDAGLYGRITHMQPMSWAEDWPVMGVDFDKNGIGEPVLTWKKPSLPSSPGNEIPATSDDFTAPHLGRQWQWNANHEARWVSLTENPGHLRFYSQPNLKGDLLQVPALLCQKLPSRMFTMTTDVQFSPQTVQEQAGLAMMGRAHATLAIRSLGNQAAALVFLVANEEKWTLQLPELQKIHLRVCLHEGGRSEFSYALDSTGSEWESVPVTFVAEQAEWIGARVAIYSLTQGSSDHSIKPSDSPGYADFGPVRFS